MQLPFVAVKRQVHMYEEALFSQSVVDGLESQTGISSFSFKAENSDKDDTAWVCSCGRFCRETCLSAFETSLDND